VHDRPPGPIRWEHHAKPHGGDRWVARLSTRDDETYRRLIDPLVPSIERSLGPRVFANRAARDGRLLPWPRARSAWRRAMRSAVMDVRDATVVVSDVRDCYGSMGERALAALGVEHAPAAFLRSLTDEGVRGLPIGPEPSAILANGILSIADREAAAAGCHPIRWVDDVILVAAGRRNAQRAFDAWRRGLEQVGLEPNDEKTCWVAGRFLSATSLAWARGSDPGSTPHDIIAAP
jgi:hypothetical protein